MNTPSMLDALRGRLVALAIIIAIAAGRLHAAENSYQLKVVTERADAVYEMGQQAQFLITVTRDGQPVSEGKVSYIVDDFTTGNQSSNKFPKGELNLDETPAAVLVESAEPGFLRCRVAFQTPERKLQAVAAAGFSPLKISHSLPVPDDFDQFWADQKRQLAKLPLDEKLTPVEQPSENIECFDVQVQCLGGAPVSGYLAKPKDAKPKSLPAVLWVHGAGVRSSSLPAAIKGAQAGMLSLDINAHGIPNGEPAEFYRELREGPLRNYRYAGRESRETSYFRGMFLRLVRAIDFLTSRPEWDGKVLAVTGHSQGGGQSLVAGGLDDRVTIIAAGVPAICDHSGQAAGRVNGWPKLVPTDDEGKPNPKILQASRYVDAVNFASRCRAEAIMSVGFIDSVCPPSSCYAAYNLLKGNQQIINVPLMGHAAPQHIQTAFFARILQHVEQIKGTKKTRKSDAKADTIPVHSLGKAFACADYGGNKVCLVDQQGRITWQYPAKRPQDIWVLPNGNILFSHLKGAIEVTRDKKIVWEFKTSGDNEIHACQPLPAGKVMVAESGPMRIIEIDRDGEITREVKLTTQCKRAHGQMRCARKIASGNYIVGQYSDNVVREYDPSGKIVREIPQRMAFGGIRLPNGNTLVATGDAHRIIEVDENNKVVWEIKENDLPGNPLRFIAGMQRLPNGNTLVCNWGGHGHVGEQPQIFEVTRDKKVVGEILDFERFGTLTGVFLLGLDGDAANFEVHR
jgi:cephalosporin-C deacetylase-like acetyl esterase